MKTILFPTDFSENALNALQYAIEIANGFGSTIYLLHTHKLPKKAGMLVSVEDIVHEEAIADIQYLADTHRKKLKNGVTFETTVLQGDAIREIVRCAHDWDIDLIIMGTQGASGLEKIFLGSTTNGVIKHTDLPILAIPNQYKFKDIKKIVFAVDSNDLGSVELLKPLLAIAKKYSSKIMVYHIETKEYDRGMDPKVGELLQGIEHSYHYELVSENINQSLNDFVADNQADFLCMLRRKRSLLDDVFHVSVTTKEVFNSPIPILILQEPGAA